MSMELYRRRYARRAQVGAALGIALLGVVGLAFLGVGGSSALGPGAEGPPVRALLVDETRTLQASLLVNLLAAALRETGLFELEAVFPDVESSFDDPLGVNPAPTTARYELILIVPREEELQRLRQLWIVTCPLTHRTRPALLRAVRAIQGLVEEGSGGRLRAVSVMDDAIPGVFAAIFERHGWLVCE